MVVRAGILAIIDIDTLPPTHKTPRIFEATARAGTSVIINIDTVPLTDKTPQSFQATAKTDTLDPVKIYILPPINTRLLLEQVLWLLLILKLYLQQIRPLGLLRQPLGQVLFL